MEFKAQKSVKALKNYHLFLQRYSGGKLNEINSEEIVPSDIVFTEAGDMVPADGIIMRVTIRTYKWEVIRSY